MKDLSKFKIIIIVSVMLLLGGILLFSGDSGDNINSSDNNSAECENCKKNKSKIYLGDISGNITPEKESGESNIFFKIFSLFANKNEGTNLIQGDDPVRDAAVNEINNLSKSVCNEEKLPEDIWISPKQMEKDSASHAKELEKLIQYCNGLKNGTSTSAEMREYYKIKIRLLEERRELVKYYIDTLDGQIEDMNEKKIADMEENKSGDKLSAEDEKNNMEIEKETNRFYDEAVENSNKLIAEIDSAIKKYKKELAKL